LPERDRPWCKPKEFAIAAWTLEDIPDILELHRLSGQEFLVDPRDHRNKYTLCARDDNGRLVAVLTGRVTVELQLVVLPNAAAPLSILAAIYSLWEKMRSWLWDIGITDAHAPVASYHKTFYEILKRVGFKEDDRMHLIYDLRKFFEAEANASK
jgi:hypothetical protein